MNEQPMELAPTPAPTPVDGQESAKRMDMDNLTKWAKEAGVNPQALAMMSEGEKR